jgi:hypothetical protein
MLRCHATLYVWMGLVAGCGLATQGCGTDEDAVEAAAVSKRAHIQGERAARQADADADKAERVRDGCSHEMGDLLKAAKDLGSRLDVGLNYQSYSDEVADLKVAYDGIDFDSDEASDLDCLTKVGLPLEKAVNRYLSAYRTWNRCFEDLNCDNDSITPTLQSQWAKADGQVQRAKRGLDGLGRAADHARTKADETQATARRLEVNARRLAARAK